MLCCHFPGLWNGTVEVAVKTLIGDSMCDKDFLAEAQMMHVLNHPNLVKLYGVCLGEPIFIITEFMAGGSLFNYLRNGDGQHIRFEDLMYIAFQVCSFLGIFFVSIE